MTTFEKLVKRIKKDIDLNVDIKSLNRTYAGKLLKSSGAFSWEGKLLNRGLITIGSCYSATELLKSKCKLVSSADRFGLEIEIYQE